MRITEWTCPEEEDTEASSGPPLLRHALPLLLPAFPHSRSRSRSAVERAAKLLCSSKTRDTSPALACKSTEFEARQLAKRGPAAAGGQSWPSAGLCQQRSANFASLFFLSFLAGFLGVRGPL